jgi:hypothetical protein
MRRGVNQAALAGRDEIVLFELEKHERVFFEFAREAGAS